MIVFVLVVELALIFPSTGIRLSSSFTLKFHWSPEQLWDKPVEYADISTILAENPLNSTSDSSSTDEDTLDVHRDTIRVNAALLKAKIRSIEFPAGDSTVLFAFFKKLDQSGSRLVRILHYGDSEIEGDRITGYLRNRFQKKFGGSGPGLLPAIPGPAESSSILQTASDNWIDYAAYYKKDTILPHRQFGILGGFARFTTYESDSSGLDTSIHKASILFRRSGMAYSSVVNFKQCRFFYGHVNSPFTVKGYLKDSLIWFEEIDTAQETRYVKWLFETSPDDFRIEFDGVKSPDVYGIALDALTGVAVDNLPFRGSSGAEFTRLDFKQLSQMSHPLNPGLIILEFGVNVVPYESKSYAFYERLMTSQIKYLKFLMPNTPVLVIGVSDMSEKQGNYYVTRESVIKVREAQKNAAKNTNSAYWDLFEAMGGQNSMPSWVFAQPSLAQKDFTHFNRQGGHIVAQMMFNALMEQYSYYQQKSKEPLANKATEVPVDVNQTVQNPK